ncbi:MAG: helicase, partial [Armatimonadetes bacterium]|nr:helicase [Armatimonadota bacterium]
MREARDLSVGAPFDYLASTMIYIPWDIPEPDKAGYQQAVERSLIKLCLAAGGRTLALFTSHAALKATYAAIQSPLEEGGVLLLGQGI